jgi:hypothetical protein
MDKIFIAMYNYGSYDSYTEVRLRAWPTFAEAEAHCHEHNAAYLRDVELSSHVQQGMYAWREKNPHPAPVQATLKMPEWQGKKGSKKKAPPHELQAFVKLENEARAEYSRVGELNKKIRDNWHALSVIETKRLMTEAGYTPEEVEAREIPMWHVSRDERSYEVEEIPFGAEK